MIKRGRGSENTAWDPQVGEDPVGNGTPAVGVAVAALFASKHMPDDGTGVRL
jgi:hypothetical protein